MSEPVWYRSLYWRIAFGFIALLAVLLVAQVVVFLWLTDRIVGPSSRSPQQLARTSPRRSLPISPASRAAARSYLRKKFGHIYQPFLVVLNDGRVGSNRFNGLRQDLRARPCRAPGAARGLAIRVAPVVLVRVRESRRPARDGWTLHDNRR